MKPLLIVPPAPERWPALSGLLGHKGPLWLEDIEKRLREGVPDAHDAFAIAGQGSELVANACIMRRGDVGILGHVFTRPDHRRRGFSRRLIEALLAWFDMTGGRWLYLGCRTELVELYEKFGFHLLHRVTTAVMDDATMLRRAPGVGDDPLPDSAGEVEIRDVTRADWPLLVALLQHRAGADPRVNTAESAVNAELSTLELLRQQEQGQCQLLAAKRAGRVVGLGSLATEKAEKRTYAMLLPHDQPIDALRAALLKEADTKGYEKVDFPMEALA